MDAYMDLSILLSILISLSNLYFVKTISLNKLKIKSIILISIFNGAYVYCIYLSLFLNILIKVLFILLISFIFYRKYIGTFMGLYLISDIIMICFINFCFKDVNILKGIAIINTPKGLLSLIFCPIFVLSIYLSSKFVDYVYHLNNYKTTAFVQYLNKKIYVSAYFDSGNTIKYHDSPVVFISNKNIPFDYNDYEIIEIEGITGFSICRALPCLLSIEDRRDSVFIYLAIIDENKKFHGCEVLLNAYLM